jgi:RHS repeat-associated protein
VPVIATDASGNSRTNNYQVTVPSGASKILSYDLDGNLTSDGEKTYEWDAASRLIAINYNGTTNRSEFNYDGLSRRVQIVEKVNTAIVSEKRFVWNGFSIAEERDGGGGTINKRFFAEGMQIVAGTTAADYYYAKDHLGSIRELTDGGGALHARYDYDPYGRRTKLAGDMDADFAFTGHYYHQPSALNLALFRAYDASLGRWISRDPIEENGGINLYSYVSSDPENWIDPWGLSNDTYVPDNSGKHGGPHIDRYNPGGQNVGRYRPDGSGIPHKGNLPPPIPNSDEDKFKEAADRCKKAPVPSSQGDSPSLKPPSIPWWLAGAAALLYLLEALAD